MTAWDVVLTGLGIIAFTCVAVWISRRIVAWANPPHMRNPARSDVPTTQGIGTMGNGQSGSGGGNDGGGGDGGGAG